MSGTRMVFGVLIPLWGLVAFAIALGAPPMEVTVLPALISLAGIFEWGRKKYLTWRWQKERERV